LEGFGLVEEGHGALDFGQVAKDFPEGLFFEEVTGVGAWRFTPFQRMVKFFFT